MSRKKQVQQQIAPDSTERLTLIATTYGELSMGQRYSLIADDDPLALRYHRRRSTSTVEHALDTPVFTAKEFPEVVYESGSVKSLLEVIETHFGSDTQRWRYDGLTNQLVIGLPTAPCNVPAFSAQQNVPLPPLAEPEGSVDTPDDTAESAISEIEQEPSGGVEIIDMGNGSKIHALPMQPDAEAKVKHTRVRWDDKMRKLLTKMVKAKSPIPDICEAVGKVAGKPLSENAIISQAHALSLGKYLPKKRGG